MNTTVYFIVLGIFLVSVLLSIFIKKNKDFKSFCIFTSGFIFFIGLTFIPISISSEKNQIIKELSKSEYTVEKVQKGLLINYKNSFVVFDNYNVVNSFNDSTKVYLIIDRSFYKINLSNYIRISGKYEIIKK